MLKLIHSGVTDLNRMAALFNLYSGTFKVITEEIFIFEVFIEHSSSMACVMPAPSYPANTVSPSISVS